VWYKHRDNYFLPTYAELISMGLVRAANTVYESVVFSSIVYWMIGYARDAGEKATPPVGASVWQLYSQQQGPLQSSFTSSEREWWH
jgi:hypothetical protein